MHKSTLFGFIGLLIHLSLTAVLQASGTGNPSKGPRIQSVGMPAVATRAYDVSNDGKTVVGFTATEAGQRAFRWSPTEGVVELGGSSVYANAVSSDGRVIVGVNQEGVPFRWTEAEGVRKLADFGPGVTVASGVSRDGSVIVGHSPNGPIGEEAYRWTQDQGVVWLGDLPGGAVGSLASDVSADGLVVVGGGLHAFGYQAFRWTPETGMFALAGARPEVNWSSATGVSADGTTIVGYHATGGNPQAFKWTDADGMIDIGSSSGANSSSATDVSGNGAVVVGIRNEVSAFIWTEETQMLSLSDYLFLRGVDVSDWRLVEATAVSDNGRWIVGYGVRQDDFMDSAFIVDLGESTLTVPDQNLGSLTLLSFGLATLLGFKRRIDSLGEESRKNG